MDLPIPSLELFGKLLEPHVHRCCSIRYNGRFLTAGAFFPLPRDTRQLRGLEVICGSSRKNEYGHLKLGESSHRPPRVSCRPIFNEGPRTNNQLCDWTKVEHSQLDTDCMTCMISELSQILERYERLKTLTVSTSVLSGSLRKTVELPSLTSLSLRGSYPSLLYSPITSPLLVSLTLKAEVWGSLIWMSDLSGPSCFPCLKSVTLKSSLSDCPSSSHRTESLLMFFWVHNSIESFDLDVHSCQWIRQLVSLPSSLGYGDRRCLWPLVARLGSYTPPL